MEQTIPTRPRSTGRPRLLGTTRTRSFFTSRERKSSAGDGGIDFPLLILQSKDEATLPTLQNGDADDNEVDTPPLIYSLLGNFDDDSDVFPWDRTRTVKPQNAFVDDMQYPFNLFGIMGFHKSRMQGDESRSQSGLICQPCTSSLLKGNEQASDLKPHAARGPIGLLLIMCHRIASLIMTFLGNMAQYNTRRCTRDDAGEDPCRFTEDGLVVNAPPTPFVAKSRNLLRLERELSLEMKSPNPHTEHSDTACPNETEINGGTTQEKRPITAKIDESYWLNPGEDLVGPQKRGGNVRREVNLTVDVGQIKLWQHPELSDQEKALARVSCLYDQYRTLIEAVIRVTEIVRKLQTFDTKRSAEVKMSSDSRVMINPLLNDLKSSAASLVMGTESIKKVVMQMKLSCADVEFKTSALSSYAKLSDDVKELGDVIKTIRPILSRFREDEFPRSSVNVFQLLTEVEAALFDLDHVFEVIELVMVDQTTEVKIRRRKTERYFARLLVNGHVVGDTKIEKMDWASFSVNLGHRFNCKMIQRPTFTYVQIWKSSIGFLPSVLISSIAFSPELLCTQDQLDSQLPAAETWLQFSSYGSDVKGAIRLTSRLVERTLKCSSESPGIQAARMPINPKKLIGECRTYTHETVKPPYIRCPDRQCMMEFRHNSGTLFTNKTLFEEPLRHALIKTRQRNPTLVPSPIPITEFEVQNNDDYHDLIKNDAVDDAEIIMNDAFNERPHVVRNQTFSDILKEFKEFQRLSSRRKNHFSELIQDVSLFRFGAFELLIPSLPRRRSLFPKTVQRLPLIRQTNDCSLLLTLVGGYNVPTRVEGGGLAPKANSGLEDSIVGINENRPFLSMDENDEKCQGVMCKIKFRGKNYRTKSIGCPSLTPQWKETLTIPLCENFEGSFSLQDEVLDIYLFDRVIVDSSYMGGFYEDEDTKSTEYRYLAQGRISLDSILHHGTINGLVPCNCPDYIVGYTRGKDKTDEKDTLLQLVVDPAQKKRHNTMLHIHITSDPLTIFPQRGRPEFQSAESVSVVSKVEQWSQTLNASSRSLVSFDSILWPDSRGNSFLASRFLLKQAPPPGFSTLTSCAHYTSLIPPFHSIQCKLLKGRDENMTLASQQFLNILAGTRQDHVVLLTNFFLFLSGSNPDFAADVFVGIGSSTSEGKTTCVVRRCKKNGEIVFWDAMTGCAYPQVDEYGPLQRIVYLVSTDNVHANLQPDKPPHFLDFDVSNRRMWAPLLSGKSEIDMMRVQDKELHFTPPDDTFVRQLQNEVSESVQNSIRGWRQVPTSFRPDVSAKIGAILDKLEQEKLSGNTSSYSEVVLPESITRARSVFGFALHAPFTGVESLIEKIKTTDIHRNRNPCAEYAVAARAFAYPGGVISLWVFVCTLVES